MAGKLDDRLPPPRPHPSLRRRRRRYCPPRSPSPAIAVEWDATPDQADVDPRVVEVARHLDHLMVPTNIGRTKVREMLAD